MNTLRVCTLASMLFLLGLFVGPQVPSLAATDGTLTGELVVTNAARNQFRLVGHSGSFTAPAGIPVEALDGKPVQVELGNDGRVLQISQLPIHIEPIVHGYEVVSGQLAVADPAMRTFMIAGEDRIFVAPSGIDVRPYAGRMVDVRLDEMGRVSEIDLSPRAAVPVVPVAITCSYHGQGYYEGTSVCQSGTQYRCDGGAWRSLGFACAALSAEACDMGGVRYSDGASRCERGTRFLCERGEWRNLGTACASDGTTASRSARTCMFGGATVASGSSICREGTTFRCVDGEWVNVFTACS